MGSSRAARPGRRDADARLAAAASVLAGPDARAPGGNSVPALSSRLPEWGGWEARPIRRFPGTPASAPSCRTHTHPAGRGCPVQAADQACDRGAAPLPARARPRGKTRARTRPGRSRQPPPAGRRRRPGSAAADRPAGPPLLLPARRWRPPHSIMAQRCIKRRAGTLFLNDATDGAEPGCPCWWGGRDAERTGEGALCRAR